MCTCMPHVHLCACASLLSASHVLCKQTSTTCIVRRVRFTCMTRKRLVMPRASYTRSRPWCTHRHDVTVCSLQSMRHRSRTPTRQSRAMSTQSYERATTPLSMFMSVTFYVYASTCKTIPHPIHTYTRTYTQHIFCHLFTPTVVTGWPAGGRQGSWLEVMHGAGVQRATPAS